ncbi:MAG: rhomboid family intramembrane serine protease [Planctomycetota bacterium]
MIPLRDDVPASRAPVVTRAIVVVCALAFVLQLGDPNGTLVEQYGMVPARVFDPGDHHVLLGPRGRPVARIDAAGVPDWLTLVTCIFLHGGWLHFLGNMLFLWIFGDNVEDRFGRWRFLLFYVGCGVAASAAHLFSAPGSPVPTIGASGAIAGVMGAYLLLYPRARVEMLVVWGFFADVIVLPAPTGRRAGGDERRASPTCAGEVRTDQPVRRGRLRRGPVVADFHALAPVKPGLAGRAGDLASRFAGSPTCCGIPTGRDRAAGNVARALTPDAGDDTFARSCCHATSPSPPPRRSRPRCSRRSRPTSSPRSRRRGSRTRA